jgi:glycosyltransferase involved in cell wall biosynthesis
MPILYLLTAPPPVFAGTDAVLQEVAALRQVFDGTVLNLFPFKTSTRRFPKQLLGLHMIKEMRDAENRCNINHLFFPSPYPLPVLRLLRKPVFYTITASLDARKGLPPLSQLKKLQCIIVSSEREAGVLNSWGLTNHVVIPPGIDTSGIVAAALPLDRELNLLMASAPWNRRQFALKGVDLLLAAAVRLPFLRIIFLWRGVLTDELKSRVQRLGIGKRVEIIDCKVNVSDHLARAHATVLLAANGGIVRAFPHSLMESLVAGKPVLLSNTIAMADDVRNRGCGVVVSRMDIAALTSAIEILMQNYREFAANAARIGSHAFSIAALVENHRRVYEL